MQKMVLAAMFLAVGIILPFLTGQIKSVGKMLLPMHLTVILCSLICGYKYGAAVGFILPVLRSFLFGMPVMYPSAVAMSFELLTLGFLVDFIYSKSKWQCTKTLYKALLLSMVAERIVWGVAQLILLGIKGESFTLEVFAAGAVIDAVPGIVIQLILVPIIMLALKKAKLFPNFFKKSK